MKVSDLENFPKEITDKTNSRRNGFNESRSIIGELSLPLEPLDENKLFDFYYLEEGEDEGISGM